MALLNFKYGKQAALPAFNHDNDGNVYVTTDSQRLFVVLEDQTDYVGLSDFHLIEYTGEVTTALNTVPGNLRRKNILYLTVNTETGATTLYRYNGSAFVTISNTTEIDSIRNDIGALQTAVSALNTFKDTTVPNTYMPKSGGTFSGNVAMGSGKTLTVNTPTDNNHAATKKYVDDANSSLLGSSDATTTTGATIYDVKRAAAAAQSTANSASTAANQANDNANNRVAKSGDTMTGPLTLAADPATALQAATKQYVDTARSNAVSDAKTYTDQREAAIMGTTSSSADSATVHGVKKKAEANATAISDLQGTMEEIGAGLDDKAPTNHASETTTYGIGTGSLYGHVKLSDAINSNSAAPAGVAATPAAVKAAYERGSQGVTDAANALSTAQGAQTAADTANQNANTRVLKSGDTMTGTLILSADPTNDSNAKQAATKKYVDDAKNSAIQTAANDATQKANAVLGASGDGADKNTVYGAKAAAAAAQSAADNAREVADNAMPKTGGTFSGNVSFTSGKTLTVNAPTAGSNQAATAKYVDDAKAAAISAVQGSSSDTKDSATVIGAKKYTDDKISVVNSEIGTLKTNIGNLSNIMNFLGTTTSEVVDGTTKTINKPSAVTDSTYTPVAGDVVVDSKGKECVFDGTVWRVIGDTSAQNTAISDLQGRMTTAEGDIDTLEDRMDTAESDIDKLEGRVGTNETDISGLKTRMSTAEGNITNLQNTVGTKPATPTMDNTLWEEVADLRSDLGEKNATAGTTTAFARIAQVEANVGTSADAASTNALTTGSLYARVKKNANDITAINTAIGSSNDTANNTGSIYARIKDNDAAILDLTTLLTWGTF